MDQLELNITQSILGYSEYNFPLKEDIKVIANFSKYL